MKTTIGILKLSPVKEDGKFVFCNDAVTINGKISKGDRICIYVDGYDIVDGKHFIKRGHPLYARIVIRGAIHEQANTEGNITIEDYYVLISEYYKTNFYFGKRSAV